MTTLKLGRRVSTRQGYGAIVAFHRERDELLGGGRLAYARLYLVVELDEGARRVSMSADEVSPLEPIEEE